MSIHKQTQSYTYMNACTNTYAYAYVHTHMKGFLKYFKIYSDNYKTYYMKEYKDISLTC